jgi:hypothetical protein
MRETSGLRLFDNGNGFMTAEGIEAIGRAKQLPVDTPDHIAIAQKVFYEVLTKYPIKETPRGYFGRDPDKSSVLRLQDAQGRARIVLRVTADATPTMQFLDAYGKVVREFTDK